MIQPASHVRNDNILDNLDKDEISIANRVKVDDYGGKGEMLVKIEDDLKELDEEIEQGVGANAPKSLKSAGGAYKINKEFEKDDSKKSSPKKMSVTLLESKR